MQDTQHTTPRQLVQKKEATTTYAGADDQNGLVDKSDAGGVTPSDHCHAAAPPAMLK
jgi:hypothetical protein